MSLFKRQCSWPGCEARGGSLIISTGKCSRHGDWAACKKHDRHAAVVYRHICPLCRWESSEIQDGLEAGRRNAVENAAKERRIGQYMAEFRAQGYGEVAAEALAKKRFSEEDPQPRGWTDVYIKQERERAEFQRKISTGEVMRCPRCEQYAPVSEGVILEHWRGSAYDGSQCDGHGMLAEGSPS